VQYKDAGSVVTNEVVTNEVVKCMTFDRSWGVHGAVERVESIVPNFSKVIKVIVPVKHRVPPICEYEVVKDININNIAVYYACRSKSV
jgi:hypothetical protein